MASTIVFRRGSTFPSQGSGITLAEPVFNTNLNTFHIGLGHGVTAEWIGAPISGASASISSAEAYKIPTAKAVKDYVTDSFLGATASYVSTFNGATGAVTGVSSFNGLTGAVTGVTVGGANTFTAVQTFNGGVTFASTIDATGAARLSGGLTASRIDVTGNFKVVGNSQIGDQSTDTLTVFAGSTFNNRVDFSGTNVFQYGLTSGGAIRFNGTNAKNIITSEASLIISGMTSGPFASSYNSMVFGVQTNDPLTMYSATGVVDIATNNGVFNDVMLPALRFNTYDHDIIGTGSIKIQPIGYATSARTQYLQDASGTIALTSQLMGTVNGSTAATTAVTSFNGLTGAVGGVCAAQENTFTALQSFNSGVSCDSIFNSKFLRVGDFDGVGVVPAYVDINSQQGRITSVIDGQDIVQHTTTLTTNHVQSHFLSGISASGITTSSLYVYGNAVVQENMTVSGGVSADAFILAGDGIKALTGTTYSFLAADNGKILTMSNADGITAAIPTGLPVGFSVTVIQLGVGQVGFSADVGVTMNSYNSLRKIVGQHGSSSLVMYANNTANLAGSLT